MQSPRDSSSERQKELEERRKELNRKMFKAMTGRFAQKIYTLFALAVGPIIDRPSPPLQDQPRHEKKVEESRVKMDDWMKP